MDLRPHIEKFRKRYAEVEAALSDPKVFDNQQRAQELSREYARLKELVLQGGDLVLKGGDIDQIVALPRIVNQVVHGVFKGVLGTEDIRVAKGSL